MQDNDIEKVRIDILRDAIKDAIDTIRAIDRKYTALIPIAFFLMTTFSSAVLYIGKYNNGCSFINYLLFIGNIFTIVAICLLMFGFKSIINPTEIFSKKEDKQFARNNFFIEVELKKFSWGLQKKFELDILVKDFNQNTENSELIKKLLFRELAKVSYIRDYKDKFIKMAIPILFLSFICDISMLTAMVF
ncbi:MAG: hypothetical protein PHE67_00990 [Campylobacterales bacterium]|nr:hypothetical protein [Campylobacterales bacterium]